MYVKESQGQLRSGVCKVTARPIMTCVGALRDIKIAKSIFSETYEEHDKPATERMSF